jgi:predicted negative regulator of RcsB-dependent stress response
LVRRKLTRKEIKQDSIRSTLVQIYDWLSENSKYLIAGFAAMAILIIGTYGWETYQESRDSERQIAYAKALEMFRAPLEGESTDPQAIPPRVQFKTSEERYEKALEAFNEVAEEYPGTTLGDFSLYYAALSSGRLGRHEEAETLLRQLVSSTGSVELRGLVRNSLASTLMVLGKNDDAVASLRELLEDTSSNFPRNRVLLRMGQTYDAMGESAMALEQFRALRAEFPGSPEVTQIQARLDLLEGQLGPEEEPQDEPEPQP